MTVQSDLLKHPAINRFPQNQREWLDFIRALGNSVSTGDDDSVLQEFRFPGVGTENIESDIRDLQVRIVMGF